VPEGWYGVVEVPLNLSVTNPREPRKVYAALEGYPEYDTNAWTETDFRATWLDDNGEHLDELTADELNEELAGITELGGRPHNSDTRVFVSEFIADTVAHAGSYEDNYDEPPIVSGIYFS
jgi:hypothetical protein